jgi:hypothetical protein
VDITWVLPQPEPVPVGDAVLFAQSLRLVDLARLQSWLKARVPCPLDAARRAIGAAPEGSEARRRLLRDTYRACQNWPARLGSADAYDLLGTDAGMRFWLTVVLGPENPGLDLDAACSGLTVGQFHHLSRVAYGAAPLDELSRLITPDSFPDTGDGKPTNWGKVFAELIEQTGWSFAECGELRLTQLAALRSRGESGTGRVEPPPGMGRFAFARRQRRFFGPDRDEE